MTGRTCFPALVSLETGGSAHYSDGAVAGEDMPSKLVCSGQTQARLARSLLCNEKGVLYCHSLEQTLGYSQSSDSSYLVTGDSAGLSGWAGGRDLLAEENSCLH